MVTLASIYLAVYRASTIPEETEQIDDESSSGYTGTQNPSMVADSTTSPTSSVPGLSDDQREKIRQVCRFLGKS